MRCKLFFILFVSILFMNFIYAGFQISDKSIETDYGVSENLIAQINISFDNESLNSSFNDSIGNSISLLEFLNKNLNFNGSVNETFQTVNSDFQILYFEYANFPMPSTPINLSYELKFINETIFSENLSITSEDNSVEEALENKFQEINDLKSKLKDFDSFTQLILNETLNIPNLEESLNNLNGTYQNASYEEYDAILQDISDIKVPLSLGESATADSINFYPERRNINLDLLKTIGGGDYELDKEESYIDAVFAWNQKNLVTKLTFKEITILYSGNQEIDLKTFKFVFDETNLDTDAYFIVKGIEGLTFAKNYDEDEKSGYTYMNIYGKDTIVLSTTADVDFVDIPAFIAPSLNDLDLIELGDYIDSEKENKFSKWILFGLIMILLILAGIVAYVILQLWYKRRYENYLFKNRNNFFNIMNYINTAKKKKIKREEIVKNLRKSKWNSEQINYAMKKYDGKRTGMVELPFTKFLRKHKKIEA